MTAFLIGLSLVSTTIILSHDFFTPWADRDFLAAAQLGEYLPTFGSDLGGGAGGGGSTPGGAYPVYLSGLLKITELLSFQHLLSLSINLLSVLLAARLISRFVGVNSSLMLVGLMLFSPAYMTISSSLYNPQHALAFGIIAGVFFSLALLDRRLHYLFLTFFLSAIAAQFHLAYALAIFAMLFVMAIQSPRFEATAYIIAVLAVIIPYVPFLISELDNDFPVINRILAERTSRHDLAMYLASQVGVGSGVQQIGANPLSLHFVAGWMQTAFGVNFSGIAGLERFSRWSGAGLALFFTGPLLFSTMAFALRPAIQRLRRVGGAEKARRDDTSQLFWGLLFFQLAFVFGATFLSGEGRPRHMAPVLLPGLLCGVISIDYFLKTLPRSGRSLLVAWIASWVVFNIGLNLFEASGSQPRAALADSALELSLAHSARIGKTPSAVAVVRQGTKEPPIVEQWPASYRWFRTWRDRTSDMSRKAECWLVLDRKPDDAGELIEIGKLLGTASPLSIEDFSHYAESGYIASYRSLRRPCRNSYFNPFAISRLDRIVLDNHQRLKEVGAKLVAAKKARRHYVVRLVNSPSLTMGLELEQTAKGIVARLSSRSMRVTRELNLTNPRLELATTTDRKVIVLATGSVSKSAFSQVPWLAGSAGGIDFASIVSANLIIDNVFGFAGSKNASPAVSSGRLAINLMPGTAITAE